MVTESGMGKVIKTGGCRYCHFFFLETTSTEVFFLKHKKSRVGRLKTNSTITSYTGAIVLSQQPTGTVQG
eukprot:scaffold5653_cov147-Cylindrotheca_fusiformis.AAC.1